MSIFTFVPSGKTYSDIDTNRATVTPTDLYSSGQVNGLEFQILNPQAPLPAFSGVAASLDGRYIHGGWTDPSTTG